MTKVSATMATRDQSFLKEITLFSKFVDPTVVSNREEREAYLEKGWKYIKVRSTLPKDVISTSYQAFIVRSGSGAGIYETLYNVPNTLSSKEYEEIIAFPNAYEADIWWNDIQKNERVRRRRQQPMRQGQKPSMTAYDEKCLEAMEGFNMRVADFSSGDNNPDKVGKYLGQVSKNPDRALPGRTQPPSDEEADAIEKRVEFVEGNVPWSYVEDAGAGRDVTTSKSAGGSYSPRSRDQSSGDLWETSGAYQTVAGERPDGMTHKSRGALGSSSQAPFE